MYQPTNLEAFLLCHENQFNVTNNCFFVKSKEVVKIVMAVFEGVGGEQPNTGLFQNNTTKVDLYIY